MPARDPRLLPRAGDLLCRGDLAIRVDRVEGSTIFFHVTGKTGATDYRRASRRDWKEQCAEQGVEVFEVSKRKALKA